MKRVLLLTALLLAASHGRHRAHAQTNPLLLHRFEREVVSAEQKLPRPYNDATSAAITGPCVAEMRSALASAICQAGEALEHLSCGAPMPSDPQ